MKATLNRNRQGMVLALIILVILALMAGAAGKIPASRAAGLAPGAPAITNQQYAALAGAQTMLLLTSQYSIFLPLTMKE